MRNVQGTSLYGKEKAITRNWKIILKNYSGKNKCMIKAVDQQPT